MISIITAIHNQLSMNKLFMFYLKKYARVEYELIIVDNNSTDGSADFFESEGATVIRNSGNYSYPHCQNQGLERAKYDILAFFNNDIILSENWDVRMLEIAKKQDLDVWSLCSIDRLETDAYTKKMRNRWKAVKNPLKFLFGTPLWNLKLMHRLMYRNWTKFTEKRFVDFGDSVYEGIAGSAVCMTRKGLLQIGQWDERLQSADFDVFLRTKQKSLETGTIKPAKIMAGVFYHHYIRLTSSKDYPPFIDKDNLISIREKWGKDYANELLKETFARVV